MVSHNTSDLEDARRAAADAAYNEADFGDLVVETQNGWEQDEPNRLTRAVFFRTDGDSVLMRFGVNFEPGSAEVSGEPEFTLPEIEIETPADAPIFGFYVNLDERGEFYADVRAENGDTVFEIRSPSEDGSLVDDGFMRHNKDVQGLGEYLRETGVISEDAELMSSERFEAEIEQRSETPELS